MIQQPLAVITPIGISQHPDRQRKKLRNFVHLLLYGGAFWISSFFQDRWDMGTWGRCFEEKGKRIQLWRFEMILINWNFFSFFEVINNFPYIYYGLRLTTPLSCLFTSDLICGFSQWVGRKDNKASQKSWFAASFFSCRSTVRNRPPLLVLINRHSWRFSFW